MKGGGGQLGKQKGNAGTELGKSLTKDLSARRKKRGARITNEKRKEHGEAISFQILLF